MYLVPCILCCLASAEFFIKLDVKVDVIFCLRKLSADTSAIVHTTNHNAALMLFDISKKKKTIKKKKKRKDE